MKYIYFRCLVDGGFASIKKLYRRSDVDSVKQIEDVVNKSAKSNQAVLYRKEDGENQWQWLDWKSFFTTKFLPLRGIQKYYWFRFSKDHPGVVFVKERSDGVEVSKTILRKNVAIQRGERPSVIPEGGLSHQRATYLYRFLRPLVREEYRDVTCPPVDTEE